MHQHYVNTNLTFHFFTNVSLSVCQHKKPSAWFWYNLQEIKSCHDDVIKWKHFPRNWPFVREIHRSPVNFLHKGQWRGALMFTLIYAWTNDWVNNREAGDLRRQHGHCDVIVMVYFSNIYQIYTNWMNAINWFFVPKNAITFTCIEFLIW